MTEWNDPLPAVGYVPTYGPKPAPPSVCPRCGKLCRRVCFCAQGLAKVSEEEKQARKVVRADRPTVNFDEPDRVERWRELVTARILPFLPRISSEERAYLSGFAFAARMLSHCAPPRTEFTESLLPVWAAQWIRSAVLDLDPSRIEPAPISPWRARGAAGRADGYLSGFGA